MAILLCWGPSTFGRIPLTTPLDISITTKLPARTFNHTWQATVTPAAKAAIGRLDDGESAVPSESPERPEKGESRFKLLIVDWLLIDCWLNSPKKNTAVWFWWPPANWSDGVQVHWAQVIFPSTQTKGKWPVQKTQTDLTRRWIQRSLSQNGIYSIYAM